MGNHGQRNGEDRGRREAEVAEEKDMKIDVEREMQRDRVIKTPGDRETGIKDTGRQRDTGRLMSEKIEKCGSKDSGTQSHRETQWNRGSRRLGGKRDIRRQRHGRRESGWQEGPRGCDKG